MFTLRVSNDIELCLRSQEDAEAFFQLTDANRAYLRPWLPWLDYTKTVEDTAEYIRKCEEEFRAGTKVDLGIKYQGAWVCSVGLNTIRKEHRKAEIGYWLAEDAQGKGIMAQSVAALIDYAFADLGLNRVFVRCATENTKSIAIPRRLGFTLEGTLRQTEWMYDHFEDLYVFGLLHSEWRSPK